MKHLARKLKKAFEAENARRKKEGKKRLTKVEFSTFVYPNESIENSKQRGTQLFIGNGKYIMPATIRKISSILRIDSNELLKI